MKLAAATFLSIVTTAFAGPPPPSGFLDHLLSFGTMFPQVAVTGLDYSLDQEVEEVHFSFDAAFDGFNGGGPGCVCCGPFPQEQGNRELGRPAPVPCCDPLSPQCCDPCCDRRELEEQEQGNRELGGNCCVRRLRGSEEQRLLGPGCARRGLEADEEEPKAEDQQPRQLQEGEEGAAGGYGGSNTGTIKTGFAANEDVSDISLDVKIYYPGDVSYGGGYGSKRKLEGEEEEEAKIEETAE